MERSTIEPRSHSGWKQSVLKNNPIQSRIFGENKELPTKFSPTRYADNNATNTSKTLLRSKILSYSQDEIVVGEPRERSIIKQKPLQRRGTVNTPRSGNNDGEIPIKPNLGSQKSLDYSHLKNDSPLKRKNTDQQSFDVLKDLKLQFSRFKEKVLGQLKRQEAQIKKAIKQIMELISKNQVRQPLSNSNVIRSISQNKTFTTNLPTSTFETPVQISKNLPKLTLPETLNIDTNKYRQTLAAQQAEIESVIPKIKERMTKFFDLIGQLKTEINEHSLYSPIANKQNSSPQEEYK